MTNIEFVYFDLDDTLLDHTHAEEKALESLCGDSAAHFGDTAFPLVLSTYKKINPTVWHKYSLGEYTKEQAKVGRFEQLLEACFPEGLSRAKALAESYLARYADFWQPIDGAFEAFTSTAASLPVGILTNGFSEQQRAKLKKFPHLEHVSSAIVISEEVGYLKPNIKLFEHAASKVNIQNSSILYVGDSFRSDVEGGVGAGWHVAWYSDQETDLPNVWSFTDWNAFTETIEGIVHRP